MRFLLNFLRSAWHGLDVLRRVLHLVLMVALLVLVVVAVRGSMPRLPERGALVLRPSGEIVEELAARPLEHALSQAQGDTAPQTLLSDLTLAVRKGAADHRVQALLIETDDLLGAGLPELEELAAAIGDFRRSGKKVIAHGSYLLDGQYYLAAQADEVYLDPMGFVLLTGRDRYRMYFKDAIDKLNVDVHLLRAGKYKSAAEPFIRSDMSPEDREESEAYLRALWLDYRRGVARPRHLAPEAIDAYANGYAAAARQSRGDLAGMALRAGLVTGLRTGAQVEKRMIELVGQDSDAHSFHAIQSDDYVRVLHSESHLRRARARTVGVIVASGEILDGTQPPGSVGGDSTAALLRRAREDDSIKAVVLRIDSPGGSVLASEQIYREVMALRAAGKPVVASMGELAASGGYYIAAGADQIIASPGTITGSIGVFAVLPTVDRTLAKLGVHVDGIGTTPLSGAMRLDRPLSPDIESVLQAGVDHAYAEFLERVATGRHRTPEAINEIAQGRVWAGEDALRVGLVDKLGGYQDAVQSAAQRAGLGKDYEERLIEPDLSFTEQLLLNIRSSAMAWQRALGLGSSSLAGSLAPALGPALAAPELQPLQRDVLRWQRFATTPQRPLAFCFCAVD
jgi:protease-4